MSSGESLGALDARVCWLNEETLPEITLLETTCDSTVAVTPVTARSMSRKFTPFRPSQLNSSTNLNSLAQISSPLNKTLDLPQSNVSSAKLDSETSDTKPSQQNRAKTLSDLSLSDSTSDKENNSEAHSPELSKDHATTGCKTPNVKMVDLSESMFAPERWLDVRFFPEITLLDVTRDSEQSQVEELSSMEATQDISPVDGLKDNMPPSESSGQIAAEAGRPDVIQSEELSSTLTANATHSTISFSEQSDKSVGANVTQTFLEATRDISTGSALENSRRSLEPSEPNVTIQTPAEETLGTHPANVTHDISSSSDGCAASQISSSDMQCSTSSKNVTVELCDEPVVTDNNVESNKEEPLSCNDAEMTSEVQQSGPKPAGSLNSTFPSLQPSQLRSSTKLNTTTPISRPQNTTLDLPSSNVNSPKAESGTNDPATSVSKKTPETNQNCLTIKACDLQNVTFDRRSLQKSSGSTILGETGAATFCLQNTFDTKHPSKQNGTITLSETSSGDIRQNTFDTKHPSKQNGTITLSETSSGDIRQNTFDAEHPLKQNGTITLSETSSGDSQPNTFDKSSPLKGCNATSSPKENKSEVQPPELFKHNETKDLDAKRVDTPESTFEANPAVEVASGAAQCETKDNSQSGLPMTDGPSETLGHQSMDTQDNKGSTINWDDTLELGADALITSTPMPNCKMFNHTTERDEGKALGAQKKLYGDGPSKTDTQVPSDVPSNIISDRKTFFAHPAAKSLVPPSKVAPQLKHKPASALPGRPEATSGLPMTRQRTQAETLKATATSDAPQVATGISSSYKLRPSTTGCKLPSLGLQRPQASGIPSGIQRAATGLRPPSARSSAAPSSGTNKLRGPAATNPMTKTSQAKRRPLTRGEALPIAKRKKMDAPSPSRSAVVSTSSLTAANGAKNLKIPTNCKKALPAKTQRDDAAVPASAAAEISTSSCDRVSRARALKQPVSSHRGQLARPKGHGCANCVVLEQQLKMHAEEIRELKELLKKSKEEEC